MENNAGSPIPQKEFVPAPLVPPQPQKDPFRKGIQFLVFLIVLLALGIAGYMFRDTLFPGFANNSSTSQKEGFSSNTVINGDTCSRTICSNTNKSQCIELAGTTQESGACLLNSVQADSKAQGLYEILASNPPAASAEVE